MTETISLSVPSNQKYISTIRLTTSAIANTMNFDIDSLEDLKVCISEASMNALNTEENINVIYEINQDSLTILVSGVEENVEESENNELELGIMIINSLMDKVDFCDKGIRMTKYVKDDLYERGK